MKNNEKPNILFPLLHFLGLACLLISCDSTPDQQPGQNASGNLAAYCDARTQDFLLQKENAVLLEYRHLGEAEENCLCKDPETVAAFLNALTEITVTGETSLVSSDDSDLFLFTNADGKHILFLLTAIILNMAEHSTNCPAMLPSGGWQTIFGHKIKHWKEGDKR